MADIAKKSASGRRSVFLFAIWGSFNIYLQGKKKNKKLSEPSEFVSMYHCNRDKIPLAYTEIYSRIFS